MSLSTLFSIGKMNQNEKMDAFIAYNKQEAICLSSIILHKGYLLGFDKNNPSICYNSVWVSFNRFMIDPSITILVTSDQIKRYNYAWVELLPGNCGKLPKDLIIAQFILAPDRIYFNF